MRVLHINTEPTWRGGESQMCYLINGLSKYGVESFIAVKEGSYLDRKKGELFKDKMVFPLPLRGELDLASSKYLSFIVDKYGIDIIHCHTSHGHTLGFWAKMLSNKKPKVLVTRRVDFNVYKKSSFKPLTFIKYRFMADHYITISRKIKEILISCGVNPKKISIVYSGVDPERLKGGDGKNIVREFGLNGVDWFLGNVAYIADHKDHKNLIHAFKMVSDEMKDVVLFVVGGGDRKELEDLSQHLGIKKRIIFTGFREDLKDFYALFHLFVLSSKEEGLCTSIIDALFNEVPVVATDAGGIPEIIKDKETGILVEKENPEALAKGIIWALKNYESMMDMARKGKELALEYFTVEKMVEGNYKVYRNLVHG